MAALPGVSLTASNDHDFELVPAGVNKGRALALLALMWGIPLERCAAVGDSANDLEMLQAVGCPIAMGNAAPQVQAAAARTVADNSHDGAAQAILSCLE
ncbi:MAG: HAD family hydrolase [Oscillospiraceae bacterium]